MLQIIMGHIRMPEAVDGDSMRKADGLADLVVGLIGTSGVAATEWKRRGAADIPMLMPDRIESFLDLLLCGF